MGPAPAFASVGEALDMVRAGLGYLAAADAAQLSAATQAECLRGLEQAGAVLTAARASVLAGFTAGQGYADDAAYSARAWLIHQTRITPGAAVGHTAWAKRVVTHPRVVAALAAGTVTEPVGRLTCLWTGKPPAVPRATPGELQAGAAAGGLGRQWTAQIGGRWATRRASASQAGSDGGAWLDGGAAGGIACDGAMAPLVTADVNVAALEELVRVCAELDRLRRAGGGDAAGG